MTTSEEAALEGKKVLVVDDEPDVLETVEDLLMDEIGKLDTAKSYEKAVEMLSANGYDAAIFDLMGVRGLDLVRDFAKKIPVVVLTGQAVRPVTVDWLKEHGARAYLPKPDVAELSRCLKLVLSAPNSMELWNTWLKAKQKANANAKL